jgi:hypothetical protein
MFDFQTQTITTSLVFASEVEFTEAALSNDLRDAMTTSGDVVQSVRSDVMDGISLRSATTLLQARLQKDAEGTQLVALSLAETVQGTLDGDAALQTRMTRILRALLSKLPVAAVEWMDTGLRIPADSFAAALQPEAPALAPRKIAPRRVVRSQIAAATRLSADDARARIDAAQNPAMAVPPLSVTPRRVAGVAATTPRLTPETAERIVRLLPRIEHDRRVGNANANDARSAVHHDAHIRTYEAHLLADLRRDAGKEEIAALRAEHGVPTTEARLSTWALSLTVATVSLPMALPVIAYNVARGEDFRAAALVLGLAGFFSMIQSSGALAGVMGAF